MSQEETLGKSMPKEEREGEATAGESCKQ